MEYSIFFEFSFIFFRPFAQKLVMSLNVCKYFLMKHLTYVRHLHVSVIVDIYSFHAKEVLNSYVLDSFVSCLLQEVK